MTAHLLLDLQLIDFRRKVRENLVSFLMELELRSDKFGEVTQRLGSIEDLHQIHQSKLYLHNQDVNSHSS